MGKVTLQTVADGRPDYRVERLLTPTRVAARAHPSRRPRVRRTSARALARGALCVGVVLTDSLAYPFTDEVATASSARSPETVTGAGSPCCPASRPRPRPGQGRAHGDLARLVTPATRAARRSSGCPSGVSPCLRRPGAGGGDPQRERRRPRRLGGLAPRRPRSRRIGWWLGWWSATAWWTSRSRHPLGHAAAPARWLTAEGISPLVVRVPLNSPRGLSRWPSHPAGRRRSARPGPLLFRRCRPGCGAHSHPRPSAVLPVGRGVSTTAAQADLNCRTSRERAGL